MPRLSQNCSHSPMLLNLAAMVAVKLKDNIVLQRITMPFQPKNPYTTPRSGTLGATLKPSKISKPPKFNGIPFLLDDPQHIVNAAVECAIRVNCYRVYLCAS